MTVKTIGKVKLNLIDCDITTEEKSPFKEDLLNIVRNCNSLEYPTIIEEKAENLKGDGYPYLYHLSEIRENIVRWLPIEKKDSVLEIGAECGGITGAFIKLSENVTVTCNCATDAEIIAERFSKCKNLCIFAGEKKATLKALISENTGFNWVILKDPHLFEEAKKLVSMVGRIIFITDNRMGMKNLSGVKGYGDGDYFEGVEGKSETGFTFPGLKKLVSLEGFDKAQIYYPYPDYRFMKMVFSNQHLPKPGELVDNLRNFDSDRLMLFNEKEAFDASCEDGSFPYYSNSYLIVLGAPLSTEYARFSNDRANEYKIYTSIENNLGIKVVKKHPLTEDAKAHIRSLGRFYEKLNERYMGGKLRINKCSVVEIGDKITANLEFVQGIELSRLMDMYLQRNDLDSFYALLDKYIELVGFNQSAPIADLDVVFSNIIVNKEDWTLIDYEWCKESPVTLRETAYRAIYCYLLEDESRKKFNRDLVLSKLELSSEAAKEIELSEASFQKRVTGRFLSLSEIRERLSFKTVDPIHKDKNKVDDKGIYKFKIYPGGNAGEFSEETAFLINDAYKSEKNAKALVPVALEDRVMRIDPIDAPCILKINECKLSENDFPIDSKKFLVTNGKRLSANTFLFNTNDPNMYFNIEGVSSGEDTFLYLDLDLTVLDPETAEAVSNNIKKFF